MCQVAIHWGRTTIVLQTNITRGDGKLAAIVTQTQIVLLGSKAGSRVNALLCATAYGSVNISKRSVRLPPPGLVEPPAK